MQRRKRKFWNKLKGKLSLKEIREKQVERLICAIQQEIEWDNLDIKTYDLILKGKLDWSGKVVKTRKKNGNNKKTYKRII